MLRSDVSRDFYDIRGHYAAATLQFFFQYKYIHLNIFIFISTFFHQVNPVRKAARPCSLRGPFDRDDGKDDGDHDGITDDSHPMKDTSPMPQGGADHRPRDGYD